MRKKRLPRKASSFGLRASLSIEQLEERWVFSFTPVLGSFDADNFVRTSARAGDDPATWNQFQRSTTNGTRLNSSSIAGDDGGTALTSETSASSIAGDLPSLAGSAGGSALATQGASAFGDAFAGVGTFAPRSTGDLSGSYEALESGILRGQMIARISVSSSGANVGSGAGSANFSGQISVEDSLTETPDPDFGVWGTAVVTSQGSGIGGGAESTEFVSLSVVENGILDERVPEDYDEFPGASSRAAQLSVVFYFEIIVNEGQIVTISAEFDSAASGYAGTPNSGVSSGRGSGTATISIFTEFEPIPDPDEDDTSPPLFIWDRDNAPPPLPPGGPGDPGDPGGPDDPEGPGPGGPGGDGPGFYPRPIVVTTEDDELDDPILNPGGYHPNDISLREALSLASDTAGDDVIGFAPWINDIQLTSQLVVDSNVRIVGHGAEYLTIDANDGSRIFSVDSGVQATIARMTLKEGAVTGSNYGGAIRNAGDLTLNSVVVSDNHSALHGGAIYNAVGAKLRIEDSTFTLNSATTGGAIYSASYLNDALVIERSTFFDNEASNAGALYLSGDDGLTGTATIRNSTFSGNRALSTSGGAIRNGASAPPLTIINSTIAYNTSVSGGGGIDMHNNSDNRFILHNTILAHNDATSATTDNLNRAVNSTSSYNVIGYGGTSGLTDGVAGNDLLGSGISAGLAPLGDYGGKTKTHALLSGSPALDKASNDFVLASDQRGYDREYDLTGVTDGGDGYRDIGAYEAGVETTLTVRSDGDRNDSVTSQATIDSLRLREALALAAALAGSETIVFEDSLHSSAAAHIVLSYDGSDVGSAPDSLTIPAGVSIVGPGAQDVIIDGNDLTRVFFINVTPGDEPILLQGLTVTGGAADVGAGVWVSDADLTLRGVRVVENAATNVGGGVYSENVERLLIASSEISGNTVGTNGAGGGIYDLRELNDDEAGLQIINSTISSNSVAGASGKGGGLYLYRDADSSTVLLPIVNSTIAFNTAASGGGIYSATLTGSAFVQIRNSIVTDNVNLSAAANNVAGLNFNSGSYNLIGLGGSGGLVDTVNNNIVLAGAETSGLKALGYYGGPTRTHALRYDSVAIDAGFDDFAEDWELELDQRGEIRNSDSIYGVGDGVDIGALELVFDEEYS